jgi:PKD repeat protein
VLVQKIKCKDLDENDDSVRISPVRAKNVAANPCSESEIDKIEVRTEGGALLGEKTDLTGLNAGGVVVSTLQNNTVADNSEVTLYIYVTFAGPEAVTAGHKLKFETTVFSEENGHSGEQTVTSAEWTLAINHRPVVDFTFAKATTASALRSTGTPLRPMQFTYEDTVQFTSTVTDPDGAIDEPFTYLWNFGDGKTSTTQNPTHQYPNGGTFQVTLTVTDARGVAGSKTKTFSVEPPPVVPAAQFTWAPQAPATGEEVTFTDTSTTPTGTTITDRSWDLDGDGTEDSDAENPTHTYSAPGTYTVSLTVTNSDAQTDTVTHEVTVPAAKPTANFDYSPTTPDVGDLVTFTDKSSAVDPATIETWAWNFGDDSTSTDQNPTHAYATMGTYTVSLTVTDSEGQTSNAYTEEVVVGPATMVYSYPNPASDAVTIVYRVPDGATDLKLRIFDITGALVYEADLPAGGTEADWDLTSTAGDPQPNGLYLCRLTGKNAAGKTIRSQVFKLLIDR